MQTLIKRTGRAIRWAYGDSLKYIGFMLAMTSFIVFLMTLIAYPIQTLTTLVIGFAALVFFVFFDEWK